VSEQASSVPAMTMESKIIRRVFIALL
jgi:hypothetical protein